MKEREISLIDFLYEVLLRWRIIIVVMLLGGIILGGYSYWQAINNSENVPSQNTIVKNDSLENELTIAQKSNIKAVIGHEEYSDYYENSIVMQIDAQNVPTVYMTFCVTATDAQMKNIVISTYTRLVKTGINQWLIQNNVPLGDMNEMSELIKVNNDIGTQIIEDEADNKGLAYISVIHKDEEQCKELARYVKEFILAQRNDLEEIYGEHEVVLVSETFSNSMDLDLMSKQRTTMISVMSGNTTVETAKKLFTPEEKYYYEMLKNEVEEIVEDGNEINVKTVAGVDSKYVILGMVIFACGYIFYCFLQYVLNNKLRVNNNLNELYGIPQIGVVLKEKGKKKFGAIIDKSIISLKDRNVRKFTQEESEEIVAVAIKMAVRKSGTNEVSLVGCEVKKQTEDICNNIKALLEKEDIAVTVLDNVLYNAETLEKLENTKNAVLVEKVNSTMYDEVAKEIELLQRNKINVLGGILVE